MKKKILKYILITILVIILCVIALVGKKVTIISKLDKRVRYYEDNKNNIYISITNIFDEKESKSEIFIKDEIEKAVISKTQSSEPAKLTQITYPTERKVFFENDNEKILDIYKNDYSKRTTDINFGVNTHTTIPNFAYCMNLKDLIKAALTTDIKFTQQNGKLCYELSGENSSLFIPNSDYSIKFYGYLEKDTGLPIKYVEEIDNEGKIVQYISDYEIKFDCVTDEDISAPNEAEYTVTRH